MGHPGPAGHASRFARTVPKKEKNIEEVYGGDGTPGRTRTRNLVVRSHTLYPIALRGLASNYTIAVDAESKRAARWKQEAALGRTR